MKDFKYIWVLGLLATFVMIAIPVFLFVSQNPAAAATTDPWDFVEPTPQHTDHSALLKGPYQTGQEVTKACLSCHPDAAHEVTTTAHWTWLSEPVQVEGRDEPIQTGKKNLINNFCIGIQSNWAGCTKCHAGYGWDSADFDFSVEENVDCLVCHEQSGAYVKGKAGVPADTVDLAAVAQSVALPTRENCGSCHFNGGGGNGVKHGDLDESLYFPSENVDVHMGRLNFQCITCHETENHEIAGRAISVSVETSNQVACTDCHDAQGHDDDRINAHTENLACQTCHIPSGALREPTKMEWDWSEAGQDREDNPHEYLKIKGSFVYESNFTPDYLWYNGSVQRYLLGDPMNPDETTPLNLPNGGIADPNAKIWPFKIHYAKQPYDTVNNILLQPSTAGEGGYWTTFDWDSALRLGSEATGLPYSGSYGFAPTSMYWTQSHMVVPKEYALQCTDCHGEGNRMDWNALGYDGDPMLWGGREQ